MPDSTTTLVSGDLLSISHCASYVIRGVLYVFGQVRVLIDVSCGVNMWVVCRLVGRERSVRRLLLASTIRIQINDLFRLIHTD
jgi:hypothetical protein